MKKFSKQELAKHNGRDGIPAYVAHDGKIYDVSASFHWKDGEHQVLHYAGADLTNAMEQAPHSEDLLERFPVVGILQVADEIGDHQMQTQGSDNLRDNVSVASENERTRSMRLLPRAKILEDMK